MVSVGIDAAHGDGRRIIAQEAAGQPLFGKQAGLNPCVSVGGAAMTGQAGGRKQKSTLSG